ncbi:MAG: PIN domain-containing protein [Acidobacteria bacterium]|nr:MAG: PIN domain-containing protein [Acidobacteriota bacterium]
MPKTIFVDSNVFLRFFTVDDAGQHARAAQLFEKAAAGRLNLITGPPVLFEIAWTLRAAYDQPRERVLDVLAAIQALSSLALTDALLVEQAIELARKSGQEYADAYIVAAAQKAGASEIATFNQKHFDKLGAKLHGF